MTAKMETHPTRWTIGSLDIFGNSCCDGDSSRAEQEYDLGGELHLISALFDPRVFLKR